MAESQLDGGAVAAVAKLAAKAEKVQQVTLDDGRILAGHADNLREIFDPEVDTWPATLVVHSLSGLVDYIESNPDNLTLPECTLLVENPGIVTLLSNVRGPARKRIRHAYVKAIAHDHFGDRFFGAYHDVESMVIALQARFIDSLERARLLQLIGNVEDGEVRTQGDDGVSQKVTVKAGVSLVNEELAKVPNPVDLAPFRTFPEIEDQVESPFVVRLRKGRGVEVALFEADGGAWQQKAIDEVKAWLGSMFQESPEDYPKIIG